MNLNKDGLDLIKNFEGCKLTVYADGAGLPTVGYGHMDRTMTIGNTIDQEEANTLLDVDLTRTENVLRKYIKVIITDNQFSALVSLAFNIGVGNFVKSTLLKLVNEEEFDDAAKEFMKWDHLGQDLSVGLMRRREAEKALFLKA